MLPDSFLKTIEGYQSAIDNALTTLVKKDEPTYLYDPIKFVYRGKGKRLRPILVILVGKMFGTSIENVMPAALAVEILHNFSLVHDDIMDQDDTRHGLPTVYKKWDESTAILAGDAIFAMAYDQLTKLESHHLECIKTFNDAAIKLCEGQAMDKAFESREDVSIEEYLTMVGLKTGTLLSLCCHLGSILGDVDEDVQQKMKEFGLLLGQSFQIQDDVLEIFSNSKEMGKSLGSDILTGKKTYLICKALQKDPVGWKRLMSSHNHSDMESEILPSLRIYFEDSGIIAESKEEIERLMSHARSKLNDFDDEKKQDLLHFMDILTERKK